MPHSSSILFLSATRSSTDIFPSSSNTLSTPVAAITAPPLTFQSLSLPHPSEFVARSHLFPRTAFLPRPEPLLPELVALRHFPVQVSVPPGSRRSARPLRTCRPAPAAARCGRRSGRTGPAAER